MRDRIRSGSGESVSIAAKTRFMPARWVTTSRTAQASHGVAADHGSERILSMSTPTPPSERSSRSSRSSGVAVMRQIRAAPQSGVSQ